MSQAFRSPTRWAIYFRDGLKCTYCGVTLLQLLERRDGNFLSLDHVELKSQGGSNVSENLVTACFSCNHSRGTLSVRKFAKLCRIPESTIRRRLLRAQQTNLAPFRVTAALALGHIPGFPVAQTVLDHDFLVRTHWRPNDLDAQHWKHLRDSETLFCVHCQRPKTHAPVHDLDDVPVDDDDVPF